PPPERGSIQDEKRELGMSEGVNGRDDGMAWWAKFAMLGGIFAVVLMVFGPLGYRTGLLGVSGAVLLAPGMAVTLAAVSLLFAIVGLYLSIRRGLTAERMPVLVGGGLSLAIVINMAMQFSAASAVPPIHDITTAPEDPPLFVAVVDLRGAEDNPLEYDAENLTDPTRSAYPFVQPIVTELAPAEAYAKALALVEDFGWDIAAASEADGLIEATDTTLMYGFKDDVAVRVRAEGAGSRIDLRSVSRVGQSDLGANATRIKAFIDRF
ncbi:MAG: DUF1499 domain-containing protein, partial [Pseudomonadales bacterium]|nr:DUF1499 domain-containing protein [Pseudomonadales bacterium]